MVTEQDVQILIDAVEKADSAQRLLDAVKALAAVRHETAMPTLIEVLGYNNPGAAVAAVDGLIDLGEVVVPYLLEKVDGYNYGARAWATRVFAGIGDPRALDLLLEAAVSDFSLSVRRAAARGLGNIRWSKLPPAEIPLIQAQVFETLLLVSQDPEWVVRYASVVGLQSLASAIASGSGRSAIAPTQLSLCHQILDHLKVMREAEAELAVRARVQLALQTL